MNISEKIHEIKNRWDKFFQSVRKPAECIFCQGVGLWWNGVRDRAASVWVDGVAVYLSEVKCRRVKCANPACNKSWTLRPEGLFPQRHYQLCVVAHGMCQYLFDPKSSQAKVAHACDCSTRTVRRWVDWTAGVSDPQGLTRRILEACEQPVLVPIRPVTDRLRKACTRLRQKVLSRAGQVLSLFEALGQARGYEPPGLRSVIEAVVANRYRLTTYARPFLPEDAWRQWAAPGAILPL